MIKLINLITGERFICEYSENFDNTVNLINARTIKYYSDPYDKVYAFEYVFGYAFALAKDPNRVVIPKSAIAYVLDPNDDVESEYIDSVTVE